MKKILAFAGSNSSQSINRKLIEYAQSMIQAHGVTLVDLRAFDVPIYSQDLEEQHGIPEPIKQLRTYFDQHDAFMIASPEHNGMMPAFFKNIMDWLSRMEGKIFQQKPVMLMSTSPGPRGGRTNLNHMKTLFPHLGASAVYADFCLGDFYKAFDTNQNHFVNPEDNLRLKTVIQTLEDVLTKQTTTIVKGT